MVTHIVLISSGVTRSVQGCGLHRVTPTPGVDTQVKKMHFSKMPPLKIKFTFLNVSQFSINNSTDPKITNLNSI